MSTFTFTATVTGNNTRPLPFPALSPSHIRAWRRVGGTGPALSIPVTVTQSGSTLTATVNVSNGDQVFIRRLTPAEPVAVAINGAPIQASTINRLFQQALYLAEENRPVGLLTSTAPQPSTVAQFLVSQTDGQGGFFWSLESLQNLKDTLGITATSLPSPTGQPDALITANGSGTAYTLVSRATLKTSLGVRDLPAPVANRFLWSNGSSVYALADAAATRGNLGLGTVATLNVGTAANNVVQLDASGKLPAVDGSLLTNVNPSVVGHIRIISSGGSNPPSVATGRLSWQNAPAPSPSTPPWVVSYLTSGTNVDNHGIGLRAGTYLVSVRVLPTWSSGTFAGSVIPQLFNGSTHADLDGSATPWGAQTLQTSSWSLTAVNTASWSFSWVLTVPADGNRITFRANTTGSGSVRILAIDITRLS